MIAAPPRHTGRDERLTLEMVGAGDGLWDWDLGTNEVCSFLKTVAEPGGWTAACVWLDDGKALRCTALWHETGFDAGALDLRLRRTSVALGQGLAGTAWAKRKGQWSVVLDPSDPGFAPGLLSSLAAPIVIGGAIVGVIQLFAADVRQRDDSLLDVLSSINVQFDQVIGRRRMETTPRVAELKCLQIIEPPIQGNSQTSALRRNDAVEAGVTSIQRPS